VVLSIAVDHESVSRPSSVSWPVTGQALGSIMDRGVE